MQSGSYLPGSGKVSKKRCSRNQRHSQTEFCHTGRWQSGRQAVTSRGKVSQPVPTADAITLTVMLCHIPVLGIWTPWEHGTLNGTTSRVNFQGSKSKSC